MVTRVFASLAILVLAVAPIGCSTAGANLVNRVALAGAADGTPAAPPPAAPAPRKEPQDYKLGPGDLIDVGVFEWDTVGQNRVVEVRVSERGAIALPLVGEIEVAGRTIADVRREIESRFVREGLLKTPFVTVGVREYASKRVAVLGAVEEPGMYTLRQNEATFLDVLALAGGVTERAGATAQIIRRSREGEAGQPIEIDLVRLLDEGDLAANPMLRDGDAIHVSPAPDFYVQGYVRTPGPYPLRRPTMVLQGIARAGGLIVRDASPRIALLRRGDGEVLPLDLVAIAEGEAPNLLLRPEDMIEVRQGWVRGLGLELWDAVKSMFYFGWSKPL